MEKVLTSATTATQSSGMWVYYVIIAVMFIAMYFFSIRPQSKREKELKNLRDHLEIGDEIMTIGGVYGTVVRIKDDRVTIASSAEKTKIEFNKTAISQVLNREIPSAKKGAEEEKVAKKPIKKLNAKEESEESSEQAE